jgi:NhaP-type Na+/H+ or K+/H+ antiporter
VATFPSDLKSCRSGAGTQAARSLVRRYTTSAIFRDFRSRTRLASISLQGLPLTTKESLLAGWFGPKGFASVVYGLLIYRAGFLHVAHILGLAVTASIVVYSSTDILVVRWFGKHYEHKEGQLTPM